MNAYPELVLIILLALLARLLFIFNPSQAVLDEFHFANYSNAYLTHKYTYDIHPPLGKLIYAAGEKIAGLAYTNDLKPFDQFPDPHFTRLRLISALFGILFIVCVWLIAKKLSSSRLTAFLASALLLLDNGILVQSRYILLDSMLWFFMFLSVWLFLKWRPGKSKKYLFLAMCCVGLAASVKWTGLGALLTLIFWLPYKRRKIPWFFYLVPLSVYLAVFWVHFHLLPQPKTGPWLGINTVARPNFVELDFQKLPQSRSFVGQFIETNVYMAWGNFGEERHISESAWWTWPLSGKPFWYYKNGANLVGFIPNYVLRFWTSLAVLGGTALLCKDKKFRSSTAGIASMLLLAGWLANFIPFAFITRPMFSYHYAPALTFATILLAVLLNYAVQKFPQYTYSIVLIVLGSTALSFVLTVPNTFIN